MSDSATFRRNAAAVGLVSSAVLIALSRFLYQPSQGNQPAKLLAALHDAHGRALLSTVLFVLGALPFLIAILGIGHLLRRRSIKLSNIGAGLAVTGAFCDAVASAFMIVYYQMALDTAHRDAYVLVVRQASKVQGLFSLVGALGTAVGLLLLSIGLFRTRTGPRWVPPLIWAFLALEFIGSSITPAIGLASVTVSLIAFLRARGNGPAKPSRAVGDRRGRPGDTEAARTSRHRLVLCR